MYLLNSNLTKGRCVTYLDGKSAVHYKTTYIILTKVRRRTIDVTFLLLMYKILSQMHKNFLIKYPYLDVRCFKCLQMAVENKQAYSVPVLTA